MTGKALIFLCDVVGYSRLKNLDQSKVVQSIWDLALHDPYVVQNDEALRSTGLVDGKKTMRFSGTGDGFYLVLWHYEDDDCVELYKFARRMIDGARPSIELKVALHEDHAATVSVARQPKPTTGPDSGPGITRRGWEQIAGRGLNHCRRIVEYADAGQVAFTEDFLYEWPSERDGELPLGLTPQFEEKPPYWLNVKHSLSLRVRFETPKASVLLQKTTLVSSEIMLELNSLMLFAESLLSKVDKQKLSARLSIFTPKYGSETAFFLDCTRFRVARDPDVNVSRSKTTYSILPPPTGLGRSYNSCAPLNLVHLPDHGQQPEEYCTMVESEWGVAPAQVGLWSRKARSFLAIPIVLKNLQDEAARPSGVLCIDLLNPLKRYRKQEIDEVCKILLERVQYRLAFLLELRSRY